MSRSSSTKQITSAVAQRIAKQFASLPQVEAIAISGSGTSEFADANSDIDLYAYVTEDIPLEMRTKFAAGSPRTEIGNLTWEPGDEWIDGDTGIAVDVMYRHLRWIEEQLERVLVHHQASVGYSTCFWYNVQHSQALFDRGGWFAELQRRARQPYPEELQRAIIAKNYPLRRRNQSSYLHQIELAVIRGDLVSVNHRVTALLASYFDVLFAINQLPHPGEKRLIPQARATCSKLPHEMEQQMKDLLSSAARSEPGTAAAVSVLLDSLDELLVREGLVPDER